MKLGIFFPGNNDEIIGICSADAGINAIIAAIQDIQKSFSECKSATISAGISDTDRSITAVPLLLEQSKLAIKQKVFLGKESIILFKDIHEAEDSCYIKYIIDTEKVKELTMEFEEVKGVHKIRSRGSDDDMYIDMHILTEPNMSVEKSHCLIHSIEKKMKSEIGNNLQIFVHLEPFYEMKN
jgi:hypothetical protein